MNLRKTAFLISLAAVSARTATMFTMDPWILIFEPDKRIITQVVTFKYHNEAPGKSLKPQGPDPEDGKSAPKPIEISIAARELTLDGSITYPTSNGAEDFVVYPSQFILYPGDNKKIQVQWVGEKSPPKEITFGFIATQLPLNLPIKGADPKKAVASVEMLTRYEGIIVVRPANIKPNVVVDTTYLKVDSLGVRMVVILNNQGTGMQLLKNVQFTVSALAADGKSRTGQTTIVNHIQSTAATNQSLAAGFRRKVEFPWPPGFPQGRVKAVAAFPEDPK